MKFAIVALVVLSFLLIATAFVVMGAPLTISPDASHLDTTLLPCGGAMLAYDTDGDIANGAEILVIRRAEILAVVEFGPGDNGAFVRAQVALPGRPVETYLSVEAFNRAYPHPCEIILRADNVPGRT